MMKKLFLSFFVFTGALARGQKVENIYVNLYTDSLKKGTYNYINIDGKLDNGKYIPLDTTQIIFTASDGKFYGNSLWIDPDIKKEKISIKAVLRANPELEKEFVIYIKKKPDPATLKTEKEILDEMKNNPRGKKK